MYIRIALIIFFIFRAISGIAQLYNFDTYNLDDGLSQSQVTTIFQDDKGFLWFGTRGGGVDCFDGHQFLNYSHRNGLPSNYILSITEDKKRNIWVGTTEGLAYIEEDTTYLFDQFKGMRINVLQKLPDGDIWIGTNYAGLYHYNGRRFKRYDIAKENSITAISRGIDNQLYFGTNTGRVYLFNEDSVTSLIKPGNKQADILSLLYDSQGRLWIGTDGNGLYAYSNDQLKSINEAMDFHALNIYSLKEDSEGNIWIGTNSEGLIKYDQTGFSGFTIKNGLPSNDIYDILQDNFGCLWVGTNGGGIAKYLNDMFVHYKTAHGLQNNIVWSLFMDQEDRLWYGLTAGGIGFLENNQVYPLDKNLGKKQVLSISGLKDKIWFGTYGSGIYTYQNNYFRNLTERESLSTDRISIMRPDQMGNMVIGTFGKGFMVYGNGDFFSYPSDTYPVGNTIWSLYIDPSNRVWMGSRGEGLYSFQLFSADSISDIQKYTTKDGLLDNTINAITGDNSGNIYIGTNKGLSVYSNDSFANYTLADGLSSENIYSLIYHKSALWAGTSKGVNRLRFTAADSKKQKIDVKHYGKNEGFLGVECNGNAVLEDPRGHLWFGTVEGITKYNPEADTGRSTLPLAYITDIDLFFKDADWHNRSDSLTADFGLPVDLSLNYNQNHLTFKFTGLDYRKPAGVRYKWKLENFDKEWSPVSSKRQVTYSNIPHGNFVFKLKAMSADGTWMTDPVEFEFSVKPPFWLTPWFYILVLLLVVILVGFFIRVREKNLQKEKQSLENEVRKRTHELQIEKRKIEQQKEEIQSQAEELEKINNELRKLTIVASETGNAVVIFTPEGKIEWYNEAYEQLYQLNRADREKGVDNIFMISNNLNIRSFIKECFFTRRSVTYETELNEQDEGTIWLQTTLTPIFDEESNIDKLVAIDTDISELKEAERQILQKNEEILAQKEELEIHRNHLEKLIEERTEDLRLAKEKAEESDRLKSSFLANMSHEIRTPMNAIIGFTNMLNDKDIDQKVRQELMNQITYNGYALLTLIDNIIDLAKVETGQMEIKQKNVDVNELLVEVYQGFYDNVVQKKLKFILKRGQEESLKVNTDGYRVKNVLNNLLENAIKFTEEGSITIGYEVLDQEPPVIRFYVYDTGIGISKEQKELIFERFTKIETDTQRLYRGTGLGLNLSKKVIERMGGKLWVESEVGRGSCFFFTLPLER